jgi:transposase InsO family protein
MFSVGKMAGVLDVSRSGYYDWVGRSPSARAKGRLRFDLEVKAVFDASKGKYGRERIREALASERKILANPKRIVASMRRQRLRAKIKRRYRVTTNSKHRFPVAPNLLNRQFTVDAPNRVLVSDITYLPSRSGWLYLTVFIDLFSRMVVGWCVSTSLSHEGVLAALQRAFWRRKLPAGCIIHSDRGVQYCCGAFREAIAGLKLIQSMSRKGNCWDNAVAESFFATLKTEWLPEVDLQGLAHAERELFEYIEHVYNGQRIHTTLGMAPIKFESLSLRKCA